MKKNTFTENQTASGHGKHVYYSSNGITLQQRVDHPSNDKKSKKTCLLAVKRHKFEKTCFYPSNERKSKKTRLLMIK